MANLKEESKLYKELSEKYGDERNRDISLKFFNECVDIALKSTKIEMRYVLFILGCLYDESNTGIDTVNNLSEIIASIAGNKMKASFIKTVLETALDEK